MTDEAKRQLRAEEAGDHFALPDAGWTLKDELTLPVDEEVYRIAELQTSGSNVLLVAAYQAGKTVLSMNLARALADGTPFLDRSRSSR